MAQKLIKSRAKILVLLRGSIYPWTGWNYLSLLRYLLFSFRILYFSHAAEVDQWMSIIIFQETALSYYCTKNLQFSTFFSIGHFNIIFQHTNNFLISRFLAEAVGSAFKLILFSVKNNRSAMPNSSVSWRLFNSDVGIENFLQNNKIIVSEVSLLNYSHTQYVIQNKAI